MVFICQQCKMPIGPGKALEEVYEGQTLCMTCRQAAGEKDFTENEKRALDAEQVLRT
jgi:RNase P subunit RPR2